MSVGKIRMLDGLVSTHWSTTLRVGQCQGLHSGRLRPSLQLLDKPEKTCTFIKFRPEALLTLLGVPQW